MKRLLIIPLDLAEANAFVLEHHRHHGAVVGHKFSLGVMDAQHVCGVAIVGRPTSRRLDTGFTLEVTRLCTDGTKDAASCLYGACRRATFALGYQKLITYILTTETGTGLKAAGFRLIGTAGGGSWSRLSRPRVDKHPLQAKLRYEVSA